MKNQDLYHCAPHDVVGAIVVGGAYVAGLVAASPFLLAYEARTKWSRGERVETPLINLQALALLDEEELASLLTVAIDKYRSTSRWSSTTSANLVAAVNTPQNQRHRTLSTQVLEYLQSKDNLGKNLHLEINKAIDQYMQSHHDVLTQRLQYHELVANNLTYFNEHANQDQFDRVVDEFMKVYVQGNASVPQKSHWNKIAYDYLSQRKKVVFDDLHRMLCTPQLVPGIFKHTNDDMFKRFVGCVLEMNVSVQQQATQHRQAELQQAQGLWSQEHQPIDKNSISELRH